MQGGKTNKQKQGGPGVQLLLEAECLENRAFAGLTAAVQGGTFEVYLAAMHQELLALLRCHIGHVCVCAKTPNLTSNLVFGFGTQTHFLHTPRCRISSFLMVVFTPQNISHRDTDCFQSNSSDKYYRIPLFKTPPHIA